MADQEVEVVDASNILVIHPGSLYVRIGRASDSSPCTVLHAVARKRYPDGLERVDSMLPVDCSTEEEISTVENAISFISRMLQSDTLPNGRKRHAVSTQRIAAYNKRIVGKVLNSLESDWHNVEEDIIVGDENYGAVLVIPDLFNRGYVKELVSLLLRDMQFSSCIVVQDHVAATFGVGLTHACVVDVGHEKTSISCVEDGMSIANTSVRLEYGGGDITQLFHRLLCKCAFPYRRCDPSTSRLDAFLMQKLKHDWCHARLNVCGTHEKTFVLRQPKTPTQQFTIQLADECIIAVLGILYPEALSITGPKNVITHTPLLYHCQDNYDDEYYRETGSSNVRRTANGNDDGEDEFGTVAAIDTTTMDHRAAWQSSWSDFVDENGQPLGLDEAIIRSIDKLGSGEAKCKFYKSILVVGSGLKFPGMLQLLGNRLSSTNPLKCQAELYSSLRDVDPENASWRGAAVFAALESINDVWITGDDWDRYGVRLLKENSLLVWS